MKLNARPDAIALMAAMQPTTRPEIGPAPTPIAAKSRKPKPGARAGTCQIAGHFPKSTLKALKHVMAEEDTTLQALLDEAIQDLLVKKGRTKLVAV